ncbi:MAG: hypothetical protein C4530_01370 [Desulfobacteraceae bacterium]|nr:MAG: hypothetical protein C4530_01370 [Desulfobacteraceae bacterium]
MQAGYDDAVSSGRETECKEKGEKMQNVRPPLVIILMCAAALFISSQTVSAEEFINSLGIKMVKIPAGTYVVGENQTSTVTITRPFWISANEITNEQYEQFDPAYQRTGWGELDDHPVNFLTWWEATAYCEWLNEVEKGSGLTYRLPHEYEWEWAAHGGKKFPYPNTNPALGNVSANLRLEANSYGVGGPDVWAHHAPVGSLAPNGYGLYDMIGNAKEWCCNKSFNYPVTDIHDPLNPNYLGESKTHMMRGNSCWTGALDALTVYYRIYYSNNALSPKVGFRVVAVGSDEPNDPPAIDSTDPVSPLTLTSGETQAFTVEATDPNGDPLGYSWKLDGVSVDGSEAQYAYTAYSAHNAGIGRHILAVEVSDGNGGIAGHAWEIDVVPGIGQPVTIDLAIASKTDDALELKSGYTKLTSGTQQFGFGNTNGFRFTNVPIPRGAVIQEARLSTWCYSANQAGPVTIVYRGDAAGDAAPFAPGYYQLSGRSSTVQSVTETLPVWSRGQYNDSVDLAGIVQEIVNLPGWNSGSSLAIFAGSESSPYRLIAAQDYLTGRYPPQLFVRYVVGGNPPPPPPPEEPAIGLNPSSLSFTIAEGGGNIPVTLSNLGEGAMSWTASVDQNWLTVSPAAGTVSSGPASLNIAVDSAGLSSGNYSGTVTIFSPEADNSPKTIAVALSVEPTGGGDSVEAVFTVTGWKDDGWEKSSSYPDLDGSITVGMDLWNVHRFINVSIPYGARIVSAEMTFYTYSSGGSKPLDITFYGENVSNAQPLDYANRDISERAKTSSSVFQPGVTNWSNGYWTSADLSTVIEEIVQKGDWAAGNALCILIHGSGGPRYTGAADNSRPARLTVTYIAP